MQVRFVRNHGSHVLYSSSICRVFRRHVDSACSSSPTMRIVCLFSSTSQYKHHHTAQLSAWLHYTAIPTNVHISGFRVPRQRQPTNYSILPKRSVCTLTKARSCGCVWREMSFATMNRARQKPPRVSSLVDKARYGVYRTL